MSQENNEQNNQQKKSKNRQFFIFAALFILLAAAAYFSQKMGGQPVAPVGPAEKINFDLYTMSQCPYGSEAEKLVSTIIPGLVDYVNFNVEYIADKSADGSFNSLHGPAEVEGNIYQLCVKEHYPQKFWSFLDCQNKNYRDLKSTFSSCAVDDGLDFEKIKQCAEGEQGASLLEASLNKAKALNVTGSPTFYIAGEKYGGPRSKVGLERFLCEKLDNKPKICAQLPEEKAFTAYLIYDSRCQKPECSTEGLKNQLQSTFPKIKFEEYDYSSDRGRDFYQEKKLTLLPALLFTSEIKESENYAQVSRYLSEKEGLLNLAIGASFDPTKEICDNETDDTGNGLADCADPDCQAFLGCRSQIAGRLDVFVMSECPYGTKALDAMEEVLENFGSDFDFYVNYIASENEDGTFNSLHGQSEVDENIRQLCAAKYYPEDYLSYIWCRNDDIKGDYSACAKNYPKIKVCFEGEEGKKLLSENIKLAESLGIGASPTWLVNNRYEFNGIDAETVRKNFCQYNSAFKGCENTLSGAPAGGAVPAGSCN